MDGILIIAVIVAAVWGWVAWGNAKKRRLDEAYAAYDESLSRLKKNPTNPDLKQETLAYGRAYSNLTREQKGVTIFDEIALSNDISAACAAASIQRPSAPPTRTPEARLSKLAELKNKGLVTEEEYQKERHRILSEL